MIENIASKLNKIANWCDSNNRYIFSGQQVMVPPDSFTLKKTITDLAYHYETKNTVYKDELFRISQQLFYNNNGFICINHISSGQLCTLIRVLQAKEANQGFDWWNYVHPIIRELTRKQFEDGHYYSAVRTAMNEICQIIRNFRKTIGLSESASDSAMCRHTFKHENNILSFTDCTCLNETNIQKGYENIFDGVMQAIRNPSSHENLPYTQEDSARKLMIASDLMYMLDTALSRYESERPFS